MTPQGWQEKTLGDICVIGAGNSAPQDKDLFENGIYPFFRTADVGKIHFGKINSSEDLLNEKGIKGLKLFKKGTILIPKSGASTFLNHRVKMEVDGFVVSHLATVKGRENVVNDDFLLYYLLTIKVQDLIQDQNYPSVNLPIISNIKIMLPPLPEQERIVAKLDKAFEAIDKAKTIAETNLKNAKELFESALNNVFTKNTDGWEEKKLDDVCTYKSGTTISKDLEKDTGDLLYIKVGDMNIRGNEELITTSTRFASSAEISAAQIIPTGSVIFPKRGGAIATNKKRKIIKPTIVDLNTMAIIPNKELDSNFFYYWFGQINLIDISNGTTIPQINNYSFQNLRIKYPTLLEQQKIVEQLDKIQEKTKKLEAIYTQKIKECDELKQSILQKAFRGEL